MGGGVVEDALLSAGERSCGGYREDDYEEVVCCILFAMLVKPCYGESIPAIHFLVIYEIHCMLGYLLVVNTTPIAQDLNNYPVLGLPFPRVIPSTQHSRL